MKKTDSIILAAFLLCLPWMACADVRITEIMYDPPGANVGEQWVELTNTGESTLDLYGYRLAEGGVNHKLVVVEGTTTLMAHESLVVNNGPENFSSVFPHYAGTVLKSSFSLAVMGETVVLKDSKLTARDSVSYTSEMGGKSDGNSLHLTTTGFIPGAPDPGVYTQTPPPPIVVAKPQPQVQPKTQLATGATRKVATNSSSPNHKVATAGTRSLQTAAAAQTTTADPWWEWLVGIVGLVALGVAGVQYVTPRFRVTKNLPDEFDFE